MDARIKQRVAFALKCKPSEVPEDIGELKKALDKRRSDMKKAKEAKHG